MRESPVEMTAGGDEGVAGGDDRWWR